MKKIIRNLASIAFFAIVFIGVTPIQTFAETPQNGWYEENGAKYWYENGVRQGTEGRGKEIYDPASDAWYWLDAEENGKMAVNKDVYQESDGGKWVRYDANGRMVKGWDTNENGTYYFDLTTGAMVKGITTIEGKSCIFDVNTGVGINCQWYEIDGVKYWYEGGVRQGMEGRGKEIYDPASDAWYWLDAVDGGKMAVSKDVYQESDGGKWVRYDANGHMIKGENFQNGAWYRFDMITGAMIKGWYSQTDNNGKELYYYYDATNGKRAQGEVTIDGKKCMFDANTGVAYDCKWYTIGNGKYWYERGVRQGTEGRGKEIYDPASDAWYWLDAVDGGKMAVGKDVYQESDGGKWVRYDNSGRMVKGWNTKDGKQYYFDLTTGAMAKGIVRINGTDYYFDESTGVLQGIYEGGDVSYSWVNNKTTVYNDDESLNGYIRYTYNDNGKISRETTYDGSRRLREDETYEYDSSNRRTKYTYRSYTNRDASYTVATAYGTNGLVVSETKRNLDEVLIETRSFVYDGTKKTRTYIYNGNNILSGYITYEYDSQGNMIRETTYDSSDTRTGYTRNTYYEYGGQTFLRSSITYDKDNKVVEGVAYERTGYELKKETIYTTDREISEYTVYESAEFPDTDAQSTFQKESNTYDKDGNRIRYTVYDYEVLEFRS